MAGAGGGAGRGRSGGGGRDAIYGPLAALGCVIYCFPVKFTDEKELVTDRRDEPWTDRPTDHGPTDRWTDGPTDRRTEKSCYIKAR